MGSPRAEPDELPGCSTPQYVEIYKIFKENAVAPVPDAAKRVKEKTLITLEAALLHFQVDNHPPIRYTSLSETTTKRQREGTMGKGERRVTQKEFNDLFLPVQWTSDKKNPGAIDKNEIWVHPSLLAINAYRSKIGQEPIDVFHLAQDAIAYLSLPEDKRVKHPLLTKDIESRMRMRFEFDLGKMEKGPYKEAVKELVKAAALADLYYNLQRDPEYVDHLSQILASDDVLRIRHFWQNGGPKCVSMKDEECTSLPGVKMDTNGVWWPEGWVTDDLVFLRKKYDWKGNELLKKKVLTPGSCIVECDSKAADAFQYKDKWYRPVSINEFKAISTVAGMIATHLERAADVLAKDDPAYSNFLRKNASHIKDGPLFGSYELDKMWVKTTNKKLITNFGNFESYEVFGPTFGVKALMEGVIAYRNPDFQAFIDGAASSLGYTDGRMWKLWEDKDEEFPVAKVNTKAPEALVADIILNTGAANAPGYVGGGFLLPNYDNYENDVPQEEQETKMVYFIPIIAARIKRQGLPIAKLAFDEKATKELGDVVENIPAMITFVQVHEMNHKRAFLDTDKVFSKRLNREVVPSHVYGEALSKSIEEAKGDFLGLFDLDGFTNPKLYKKGHGLITREEKFKAYHAHMGNLLRDLNLGVEDEHGRGGIMEFYLLAKHGVLTYSEAKKKYDVDYNKLEAKIPDLVKELMDVYASFDKKTMEEFDRTAQDFLAASPMAGFIAEANKSGMAEDNLPYYQVNGDLGSF